MVTITEDYVSFETAKLLREKGFNEKTLAYYECDILCHGEWFEWNNSPMGQISAPTLQMTMKWLRKVHNIHISVYPFNRELPITENTSYTCDVATKKDSSMRGHLRGTWKTYEEAAEASIKYCLENLIL